MNFDKPIGWESQQLKEFNDKINSDPPEAHIKTVLEDDGKTVKFRYIPPDKLELQLFEVYKGVFNRIINETSTHFDASKTHYTLMVWHPICEFWQRFDGVGAVKVNNISPGQWKGSTKHEKVNEENLTVPGSAGLAFMNACRGIGNYFGANLNRDVNALIEGEETKEKEPIEKIDPKVEIDRVNAHLEKIKKAKEKK